MFELRISPKAEKRINQLKKQYQVEIIKILQDIKEDPLSEKPLTRDLSRRFVYKFKTYRIIYKVNIKDKVVDILDADRRDKIYN